MSRVLAIKCRVQVLAPWIYTRASVPPMEFKIFSVLFMSCRLDNKIIWQSGNTDSGWTEKGIDQEKRLNKHTFSLSTLLTKEGGVESAIPRLFLWVWIKTKPIIYVLWFLRNSDYRQVFIVFRTYHPYNTNFKLFDC